MSASQSPLFGLVSPRVGIVRRVTRVGRGVAEPVPPIFYQAVLSQFDFRSAKLHDRVGVGKAVTEQDAVSAAIAEALERYCASQPDMRRMRRFAYKDRPGDAIPPVDCVLYSESQYAAGKQMYRPWNENLEFPWIEATELPDGNSLWVPASLTYLDYSGNDTDTYFCSPTSNGLAAGPTLEAAILAGLYELMERDSFLITWMNRLPAEEIDVPVSAEVESSVVRHYRRFQIDARVFRLPTDLPVHAMMSVLVDRSGRTPAIVVGLGCHSNPLQALRKALFETAQVHPGEVEHCLDPAYAERLTSYESVRTLEDHSAFFASPKRMNEFDFLLERSPRKALKEFPNFGTGDLRLDLDRAVAGLRAAGCRAVYTDVTTPDLEGYPIRIVRTIATGLQPIHFGYGEERLGGKRLFELPRILGFHGVDSDESTINRCPHPLP
jgi:ribosomal protein S12 methylthiotransferase accessory factor